MNIYSFPTYNLTKVLFTAEELGLSYQLHLLDVMKGEHKSPEHMKRHPLGKVPVVELNGQFFFESNSICRLLAEENSNRLYGNTPVERAKINQWIDMVGFHLARWMQVYFWQEGIKPKLMGEPSDNNAIKEAAGFLVEQLNLLNSVLDKQDFIAGDTLTIADTIAFAVCQIQQCTSLNFDKYPAITRWYGAMESRPAIQQALNQLPGGRMAPFPE